MPKKPQFPKQFTLPDTRAARMLGAGSVTITVKSKRTRQHITLEFNSRKLNESGRGRKWQPCHPDEATLIFIGAGRWDRVGTLKPWGDKRWSFYSPHRPATSDKARVWAAAAAFNWVLGIEERDDCEFHVQDLCGRCGRDLTDPVSIERGIGPECFSKITGSRHQRKSPDQQRFAVAAPVSRNDMATADGLGT